jgi:hypothetical protein
VVEEASKQGIAAGGGHPDQLVVQGHRPKEATARDEEHGIRTDPKAALAVRLQQPRTLIRSAIVNIF